MNWHTRIIRSRLEDVKKAQKDVDLKLKEDKKINNEEKEDLKEKKIKNKTILDIIIDAIYFHLRKMNH